MAKCPSSPTAAPHRWSSPSGSAQSPPRPPDAGAAAPAPVAAGADGALADEDSGATTGPPAGAARPTNGPPPAGRHAAAEDARPAGGAAGDRRREGVTARPSRPGCADAGGAGRPPPAAPAQRLAPAAARASAGPLFLATTLAGLEGVLADEARAKLPQVRRARADAAARSILEAPDPAPLFDLRTADNLYRVLRRFRVGPHRADLDGVCDVAAGIDLRPFAARKPRRAGGAGPPTLFVNASRAGQHTYSRFELAAAATAGLLARQPGWREGEADERTTWSCAWTRATTRAVLSLRLTPPTFRFRGDRAFSPAALRPTVAHALVWLSRPAPADRFLDPFCGSGTVLSERLPYPAVRLLGGDREAAAVRAARSNLPRRRRSCASPAGTRGASPCGRARSTPWSATSPSVARC